MTIILKSTINPRFMLFAECTLFVFYFLCVLSFVSVLPLFWNFPYALDFAEGAPLHSILEAAAGRTPYPAVDHAPYVIANYFPLYYAGMAKVMTLMPHKNVFLMGRIISFACMCGVSLLVFLMLLRETRQKLLSGIVAMQCVFLIAFRADILLSQVNLPAFFLSVSGLFLFHALYPRSKRSLLALVFFFVAVYTKQVLWAAFLSCFAYLFFQRGRDLKREKICFALFPLAAAAFAFYFQYKSGGNFFFHVLEGNLHPFSAGAAKYHLSAFVKANLLFLCFSLCFIFTSANALLKLYLLIAFLLCASVAREGAGFIYLADANLAVLLCAGCFLSLVRKQRPLVYLVLLFVMLFQGLPYMSYGKSYREKAAALYTRQLKIKNSLSEFIRKQKGDILTEDADLSLLNGKRWIFDIDDMPYLEQKNKWSSEQFIEDVRNKKFALVVFYRHFYGYSKLMHAVEASYTRISLPELFPSQYYVAVPKQDGLSR